MVFVILGNIFMFIVNLRIRKYKWATLNAAVAGINIVIISIQEHL